jgi:hypothetical protein
MNINSESELNKNKILNEEQINNSNVLLAHSLPPLQISEIEYKKLMKALYPNDRSKKFRR